MTPKDVDYLLPYHSHIEVSTIFRKAKTKKKYEKTLTLMEPKEWYKASELIKDLDIKERRTRELLNELEEKGVTKGKCYGKK